METTRTIEFATGSGPAIADLDEPDRPAFVMVLTHGAGGGVDSPDLLAARQAAIQAGGAVARVLQPYRVRGGRAPGPAERQDAAWLEIIAVLRDEIGGIPLVQGGRSNGARVACRTARLTGALGVLALAFPLHPPGRPERSRADELRDVGADVLVINGSRDPFGVPDATVADATGADATGADATGADATGAHVIAGYQTKVIVLAGETHALAGNPGRIAEEVGAWLSGLPGLEVRAKW